jgi:hypothetical protein
MQGRTNDANRTGPALPQIQMREREKQGVVESRQLPRQDNRRHGDRKPLEAHVAHGTEEVKVVEFEFSGIHDEVCGPGAFQERIRMLLYLIFAVVGQAGVNSVDIAYSELQNGRFLRFSGG